MNKESRLIEIAKRMRALAQSALTYIDDEYQLERYNEYLELSDEIISNVSGHELNDIKDCFHLQKEYATPKVDIRAVIFNDKNEILMIRESEDSLWALPGGWADIGCSPKEVAIKEAKEETGFDVEVVRLMAVLDTKFHNHPQQPFYIYKMFFLCRVTGGEFTEAFDILDRGFFALDNLPPLSEKRGSRQSIEMMFRLKDSDTEVICD